MDITKSGRYTAPLLEVVEITSEGLFLATSTGTATIEDWNEDDNYIDGITF